MKNLFTKLMLVAVAAMGMVACQNEPETVIPGNDNAEKATIEVIADLETTRSAFGEKDGDAYPSFWQGGEQVKAAYLETGLFGGTFVNVVKSDVATVTATGPVAKFGLTFSSLPYSSGTLLIATPAGSVDFDGSGYYYDDKLPGFVINVPMEQTPLAGSVDPKAHILTATYTGSFASAIKPDWEHAAAYGKMTLKNFNAEIDNVVVTIDTKSYILSATNVVNNVFWFGCEANEAPTTVKVAVNTTDDKAYTKTLDLSKGNGQGLPFVKGQVAEFSVNMDGVTAEEPQDIFVVNYVLNKYQGFMSSSYFEFRNESDYSQTIKMRIYLNGNDRPGDKSINIGTYEVTGNSTVPTEAGKVGLRYTTDNWTYVTVPTTGTMVVSAVKGNYRIFINDGNGKTWGYEGVPDGWDAPSAGGEEPEPEPEPTQLATPTGLTATATGSDTATVTWTVVENASSYDVTVGATTQNVTTTTATFTGLTPETTYDVSVVAVGDGTSYTNSTAATTTVTTEAEQSGDDDWGGTPVTMSSYDMWKQGRQIGLKGDDGYYYFIVLSTSESLTLSTKTYTVGNEISKGDSYCTRSYPYYTFNEGETMDIVDLGGGQYSVTLKVTRNGTKITGTYTGPIW